MEYEHSEPPPGADPGHPPYEGGAAAVRGGIAGESGFEPELNGPEPIVLPGYTIPHRVRKARVERARACGPAGFEPAVFPGYTTPARYAAPDSNRDRLG